MLTPEQRNEVTEDLADVLLQSSVRLYLRGVLGPSGTPLLLGTVDVTPLEWARLTVDYCLASKWTQVPSLLEILLNDLVENHLKVRLEPVRVQVRRGIDPNPDPFQTFWMTGQPYFDRDALRPMAKALVEGKYPLLRITGVGRSYTLRFIEHVVDALPGEFHVVPAQLPVAGGPSYDVKDLAMDLTLLFGPDKEFEQTGSTSARDVWRRVARGVASQRGGVWIFVLDGFGQEAVKPEVIETVQLLAQNIRGDFQRRIRLILLDFPHPLPGVLAMGDHQLVDPATIAARDILPCLVAHNLNMRKIGGQQIDPAALQQVAEGMIDSAPPSGKARLEYLYTGLVGLPQ